MRLWSLHPKYLDAKGLVALWREALLAKSVLEGKTNGYKNHPQLMRFKNNTNSIQLINRYLSFVYLEAEAREYHFDRGKINWNFEESSLMVTSKQIDYEMTHLQKKLKKRNLDKYNENSKIKPIASHPLFHIIEGDIENWEVIND